MYVGRVVAGPGGTAGGQGKRRKKGGRPPLLASALAPVSKRVVPCLDDDVLNGIFMR